MSMKEESVFISSNEEDKIVKEEINNKPQELSGKSKKNTEKIKKKFEKENKIQEVIKKEEPEDIKKEEPEINLEEIKIEDTKEIMTDLSCNNILPDFSNKSIREIFLYIKQKYEDNKDVKNENENNEINNYYKKINCVLTYDDIVIINKLLTSNSTIFDKIEKLAQDIIKNGDNDNENMPHLIGIIKILYGKLLILDTKNISIICVNIIKFIFHSLLDKSETNLLNLAHLQQIIETCIFLLDNRDIVNTVACCSIM